MDRLIELRIAKGYVDEYCTIIARHLRDVPGIRTVSKRVIPPQLERIECRYL
jgi:hypothetical protein